MDLISIILPYYKKRSFINQTIRSIVFQTYQKFELLIIYDDHNKNDLAYIKGLIKKNPKIKLIINKKNIGVSKSRNKGILKSKGRYICFIDADDIWNKNKLLIQLNFMKKNKCHISHTNYKIVNKKGTLLGMTKIKKILRYKDLIHSCDVGLSTVMICSKLKSKLIFPNIKTKEDFIVWLRLSKKYNFFGIEKPLVSWRKSNFSIYYTFQKIKDAFTLYSKFQNFNLIKSLFFTLVLSFNFIQKSFLQKFHK